MSAPYAPPLDHIRFVLEHVVDTTAVTALPGFEQADVETMVELLDEFGRFCVEVLLPLDRVGDREGARFDATTGRVTTAPGWKGAYAAYVEAGWGAVPLEPEHGGGGFPRLLASGMQEILTSANMAFGLAPMLTQGAVDLMATHATPEQLARFLPKMVTGEWTGTMNLTEPQAGSDVGAVETRAVPNADGTWSITGTKIFITFGEHDLTDNIVHLVLARVPDAPSGTRGISCFIVPKLRADGTPNAVQCIGIEHKMGIHGSPTCTLQYDAAVGELIGAEPNHGMAQMFTMMNRARVGVGLSGLSLAERALQSATAFASERRQGHVDGAPAGAASPIVEHPDVRRMLLHIRSHVEAMRALAYTNAAALDLADHSPSDADRAVAQERADLLTPITKAWCTDLGSELTRLGTQVHGGMGYIAETGAEQLERDIRIASIYEGTNGIQAVDLVARKLPMRGGRAVRDQLEQIDDTARAIGGPIGARLAEGSNALRESSEWLLNHGATELRDALAGASPYLRQFGIVLGGWFLARQAVAAPDDPARVSAARYYCEQVLPTAHALVPAVTAGADVLYATPSE